MSDRNHIETYIVRYLQREIAEDELREFELWLQTPEHRMEFFRLKNVHDLTKNHKLPSDEDMERSWRKMSQRITSGLLSGCVSETPKRRIISGGIWQYAAVAAVAVAVSLGVGGYLGRHGRPVEKVRPAAYNEVGVQRGGKPNTVHLSDGSIVRLNAATTLRYPADFNGTAREVLLDGEAYFEVAKDDDRPFVVKLERQNIIVRGTCFNVEAYRDESYNIVTLLEGSVSVESMDDNGLKINDVLLVPGQKVHFDHASGKVSVSQVDASLSNTWMRGEYRFKDEPFTLIAGRLEHYYDVRIHLDDERLKKIRYTGTFSLQQHIHEVLRIINHENQFRFQQTGNEIYIKSR
ncbi:MAG: DUF4974 domain-containing protein [Tannerella sp.]|nr:DUF4974 domain-containing protein [Tannerella sp.]